MARLQGGAAASARKETITVSGPPPLGSIGTKQPAAQPSDWRAAFIDIETTGFSRQIHDLQEIAIITDHADGSHERWEAMVKLNDWQLSRADPKALEVTGFFERDRSSALPLDEVVAAIAERLSGAVIIGHNIFRFDIPWLRTLFQRRVEILDRFDVAGYFDPAIDTLFLSWARWGPVKLTLDACCQRIGIPPEGKHHAMGGAERARALFYALIKGDNRNVKEAQIQSHQPTHHQPRAGALHEGAGRSGRDHQHHQLHLVGGMQKDPGTAMQGSADAAAEAVGSQITARQKRLLAAALQRYGKASDTQHLAEEIEELAKFFR